MDVKIIQGQCILAGGTVTYTGTLSLGISAYVDKGVYLLQVNATNTTTAPTINLNGLGAKTVFSRDGSALAVGAMLINEVDFFVYSASSNGFRLITPVLNVSSLAWLLAGNTLTGSEHFPNEYIGSVNNFDVLFIENNAEVMRLTDSMLAIGSNSPGAKLGVKSLGSSSATFNAILLNSIGTQIACFRDDVFIGFGVATAPVDGFSTFTIQRSGNVGMEILDTNSKGLRIRNAGGNTGMFICGVSGSQDGNSIIGFNPSTNAQACGLVYGYYDWATFGFQHSFVLNSVGTTGKFAITDMQTRAAGSGGAIYFNAKNFNGTNSWTENARILGGSVNGSDNSAYFSIEVGLAGVLTERLKIDENGNVQISSLVDTGKSINTTAGGSVTINSMSGRFRKDTSGSTFTLTNSFITANSIIMVTYASDPGITGFTMVAVAGSGSMVVTFYTSGVAAAPTNNADVNFLIIN